MWAAFARHHARSLRCPPEPRLAGRLALVTGGNAGIGLETSLGLARRGARVAVACRSEARARDALARIAPEAEPDAQPFWVPLDLADLASVSPAAARVAAEAAGRPLDVFVQNAGIWPARYATSAQGHEIAFATNVLGHFALTRALEVQGLLASARVVVVTGDIYTGARTCTSDFRYRGARGGAVAYRRSKLGNLWIASELARRRPTLRVVTVHPGVVATNLTAGFERWKRRILLDAARGAETSLIAATRGDLASGSYLHNTRGLVDLAASDAALDAASARALWSRCEELTRPFVPGAG
jgi:NAD(P)-dependent dehydrogenase (short-subunit alcohol dehydrogenase family)